MIDPVAKLSVSRQAIVHARRNVPEARFIAAPLERALRDLPASVDLVVLDHLVVDLVGQLIDGI